MLGTWLTNSVSNLDSSVYTYNVGNQRTSVIRTAENTASYTYDPIGQITADRASEISGNTARLNEQLEYVFDPVGNLNYRTNNALVEDFQANTVNELTQNTNGGTLTVMGTTTSKATNVLVNTTNHASLYGDSTFAAANMPLTTAYVALAQDNYGRWTTNTATVSLSNSLSYQYDGNGNLTNDGFRSFAYNDENQLIQVWVAGQWFSQFSYDGKMRRRVRQEYTWQGGGWVQTNEIYYVYDGNLVIQERGMDYMPTVTYTRGKDLSGALEGAGGIGGLLSMTLNTAPGTLNSNSMFYHSDGNGNVTMLINPSQYIVAKYLYDAFGNVLSKSGSMANANLYQFSSKEMHLNSGLLYYLYRFYDPNLQRWPNRDPMGDIGFQVAWYSTVAQYWHPPPFEYVAGPNLYNSINNDELDYFDTDGTGIGQVGQDIIDSLKNNWGKLSGAAGGAMCTLAGYKCYQAIKTATDAAGKYQNTVNLLNQKYGDPGDWPSGIQQLMNQWQKDNLKLAAAAAKACANIGGTSTSGPVDNPIR